MTEAVIVDAVRTPLGKGKSNGALAGVHAVDLLAHPLSVLLERTGVDGELVDDVIVGAVSQVGEQGLNIARRGVLAAGFPERVPATTIDRQCGSSQQAISFAAQGVLAGSYDLVIAGGVESMSRVPMGSSAGTATDLDGERFASRYPNGLVPQGVAAEIIAARWHLSRTQLDEFGLRSQELAAAARDAGYFDAEIAPIKVGDGEGGLRVVSSDEGTRETSPERFLARPRNARQAVPACRDRPSGGWWWIRPVRRAGESLTLAV